MTSQELKPKVEEIRGSDIPFHGDSMSAPLYLADAIRGVTVLDGTVRMNLVEHRVDLADDRVKARHIATIAITMPQFVAWTNFFNRMLEEFKASGLVENSPK